MPLRGLLKAQRWPDDEPELPDEEEDDRRPPEEEL
jgi:hypothetical protein